MNEDYKRISAEDFLRMDYQGVTIVDLREIDDVALNGIPGAINLPFGRFPEGIDTIPMEKPVYVCCAYGEFSEQYCEILADRGYDVTNVDGGYRAIRAIKKKRREALARSLLLYAVTDRRWLKNGETLTDAVRAAVDGGATMIQLREKELSDDSTIEEAKSLKAFLNTKKVPLIIDNSIEITIKSGADGVHLGQDDCPVAEARKQLGQSVIIGATAHNVDEAIKAEKDGADYLGVGAAFGSGTKSDAKPIVYLEEYKKITTAVSIPVVAIGGIDQTNIANLKGLGLSGVAVVSAVFAKEDIVTATEELKKMAETLFANA